MLSRSEKFKHIEERLARIKFSKPMIPGELESAYASGMLRKADLEDGVYYCGYCRHATVAMWSAEKNCFIYMRQKFERRFPDHTRHPEDDDGFDLFVPLGKTTPAENEIIREENQRKSG
jgi:hypothetical protein